MIKKLSLLIMGVIFPLTLLLLEYFTIPQHYFIYKVALIVGMISNFILWLIINFYFYPSTLQTHSSAIRFICGLAVANNIVFVLIQFIFILFTGQIIIHANRHAIGAESLLLFLTFVFAIATPLLMLIASLVQNHILSLRLKVQSGSDHFFYVAFITTSIFFMILGIFYSFLSMIFWGKNL